MKTRRIMLVILALVTLWSTSAFAADNGRIQRFPLDPWCGTGAYILDCGDFWILSDYCVVSMVVYRSDKQGNVIQVLDHFSMDQSIYYNEFKPEVWVEGLREHQFNRIRYDKNMMYGTGPSYRVVVPGKGVVFITTGHWVWNMTTNEVKWSGPDDAVTGDAPAFCDLLRQ